MKKIIYKDGFDGKAKIVRTDDDERFLKNNKYITVVAIQNC